MGSIADDGRHPKYSSCLVRNFPNLTIILGLLRQTVYFCSEIKSDFYGTYNKITIAVFCLSAGVLRGACRSVYAEERGYGNAGRVR